MADTIAQVVAFYGLEGKAGEDEAETARVRRFVPDLTAETELVLRRRVAESPTSAHFADHYGAEGDGDVHVIVRVREHQSGAEARQALAMFLAQCMSPPLPACRDRGLSIGGHCYCDHGDPPSRIVFTRANLFIDIASVGATAVAVAGLASAIDRQIEARLE